MIAPIKGREYGVTSPIILHQINDVRERLYLQLQTDGLEDNPEILQALDPIEKRLHQLYDRDTKTIMENLAMNTAKWKKVFGKMDDDPDLVDRLGGFLEEVYADSDESESVRADPQYADVVAFQDEYLPLVGKSCVKVDKKFGTVEDAMRAIETYKEVAQIWNEIFPDS
jgi:hypothetical protein